MTSPSATDLRPATVMVVDDEPDNLNVLDTTLSHAGYRVALFPRGELALATASDSPPDLVLLDILMPGLDGYEVCRRFKQTAGLQDIPIIFISALSAPDDITAGFACGAVDYVSKPFREAEVLARVHTHVALRQAYVTLREQHERLQALEQLRDTLVHMLVHDMRTPLQTMSGHLEILTENLFRGLPPDDRQSLRLVAHSAHVLGRMVSNVIDLSRMESEKLPVQPKAVSVLVLFHTASGQACDPCSSRTVTAQIAEACPKLFCDVDLTTRVLANLLANAIKYSPAHSEVVFGAEGVPGGVRLWVRDEGPGIPPEYHARIFEKFGVAPHAGGPRLPSTGLGLAFCKLAVMAQGGTIGVASTPGKGSTFWVILPAANAHNATEPAQLG